MSGATNDRPTPIGSKEKTMSREEWIAVGVDGSEGSKAATRWAAREADRSGANLRLVHVFTDVAPMGSFMGAAYPVGPVETAYAAQNLVDEAAQDARQILTEDRVQTLLLRADRRVGLAQAAADARLLVLGDEPHGLLDRLITGSVVAAVAAHAPAAVAVVPANWQDADGGTVVVGVKSVDSSPALIRRGFELAAGRRGRLKVLHAWEFLSPYDDAISAHIDLPAWEQRTLTELRNRVARIGLDFPGVETEVVLVHEQPAQALVDASVDAGLLVITRRPHGFPFGHLGGTGRAVLRETRCPTVVLPSGAEKVERDELAEESGEGARGSVPAASR
jgi:nucleotide-binding universal stress UspA family protein